MLEFDAQTVALLERFKGQGPGLPNMDLSEGLLLLKAYQEEVTTAIARREALKLAEQLFDLPVSSYPSLSQVCEWAAMVYYLLLAWAVWHMRDHARHEFMLGQANNVVNHVRLV